MRYLLNEGFRLCGWEKLPFALADRRTGEVRFLPKELFLLLYRCDGRHELSPAALTEAEHARLEALQREGLVRPCAAGEEAPAYRAYPARFKASAQWSVTGRCNCRCRHCLLDAPAGALPEPDTAACLEIIRQLGECGVRQVSLTGGEPLLRGDLFTLLDALREQEICVTTIYSNGLLVSDALLDALEERGLRPLFQLSYDGLGAHDRLRGLPGAEDAALRAFERCRAHGFPTAAAMCLYRGNADRLAGSVTLLRSLGCTALKVSGLREQGAARRLGDEILSQEELFTLLLDYIPRFFADGAGLDLMLDGLFAWNVREGRCFIPFERGGGAEPSACLLCAHVRRSFYISPEGRVLPCMSMAETAAAEDFPSLLETPLREILSRSEYFERSDLRLSDYLAHNPDCAACPDRLLCAGGCRALALGEGGRDYLAKDLWACRYFRDGWRERMHACLARLGLSLQEV